MEELKNKEIKQKQPKIKTLKTKVILVSKTNIVIKINNQNTRVRNIQNKKQGDIIEIKYQGIIGTKSFKIIN